jgi:hypothetical protein
VSLRAPFLITLNGIDPFLRRYARLSRRRIPMAYSTSKAAYKRLLYANLKSISSTKYHTFMEIHTPHTNKFLASCVYLLKKSPCLFCCILPAKTLASLKMPLNLSFKKTNPCYSRHHKSKPISFLTAGLESFTRSHVIC